MSKTTADTKVQKPIELASETEQLINKMINVFFSSAYCCKWMTYYFERSNVSMFGLAGLHCWSALTEVMFARGLVEYLKLRGGRLQLEDIPAPNQKENQMEYLVVEENGTCRFELVPEPHEQHSGAQEKEGQLATKAIQCLLLGKREIYDYMLKVYKSAYDSRDAHLMDFLETNYIRPIANINRKLGILQSQAILACKEDSVGIYQFNKDVEKNLFRIMTVNKLVRPDKWSITF